MHTRSVQAICSFSFLLDKVTNCSHCVFHYNQSFLLYLIWLFIEQFLNFPTRCYGHQKIALYSEAGLSRGINTVSLLFGIPTGVTKDHISSFGHSITWGLIFSSLSTVTLSFSQLSRRGVQPLEIGTKAGCVCNSALCQTNMNGVWQSTYQEGHSNPSSWLFLVILYLYL